MSVRPWFSVHQDTFKLRFRYGGNHNGAVVLLYPELKPAWMPYWSLEPLTARARYTLDVIAVDYLLMKVAL